MLESGLAIVLSVGVLVPLVIVIAGCAICRGLFRRWCGGSEREDEERQPLLAENKREQQMPSSRIDNEQTEAEVEHRHALIETHSEPPIQPKRTGEEKSATQNDELLIPDLLKTDEIPAAQEQFARLHAMHRQKEPDILEPRPVEGRNKVDVIENVAPSGATEKRDEAKSDATPTEDTRDKRREERPQEKLEKTDNPTGHQHQPITNVGQHSKGEQEQFTRTMTVEEETTIPIQGRDEDITTLQPATDENNQNTTKTEDAQLATKGKEEKSLVKEDEKEKETPTSEIDQTFKEEIKPLLELESTKDEEKHQQEEQSIAADKSPVPQDPVASQDVEKEKERLDRPPEVEEQKEQEEESVNRGSLTF